MLPRECRLPRLTRYLVVAHQGKEKRRGRERKKVKISERREVLLALRRGWGSMRKNVRREGSKKDVVIHL